MAMKFPHEVYEQLADCVKEHPCLYNTFLDDYKEKQVCEAAWIKIATEMNVTTMTGADWKKKWRSKRDCYIKNLRKIANHPNSAVAKSIKMSKLHQKMSFLAGHIRKQRMKKNGKILTDPFSDDESPSSNFIDDDDIGTYRAQSLTGVNSYVPGSSIGVTYGLEESTSSVFSQGSGTNSFAVKTENTTNGRVPSHTAGTDDMSVYQFLDLRMTSFSKDTQEWLEGEVIKLYLEAKRREEDLLQRPL